MAPFSNKKENSQSPTQYYLSELGLDLEWQNGLLQFGPHDQNGQDYINNIRSQEKYDNNSTRIRTYPHIIIPACKDMSVELPRINISETAENYQDWIKEEKPFGSKDDRFEYLRATTFDIDENKTTNIKDEECRDNCWASTSVKVILESLREAMPEELYNKTDTGSITITKAIKVLKDHENALKRIAELENRLNQLESGLAGAGAEKTMEVENR